MEPWQDTSTQAKIINAIPAVIAAGVFVFAICLAYLW